METFSAEEYALLEQDRWAELRLEWEHEQAILARDAAFANYERWLRVSLLTDRSLRASTPATILRWTRLHRRAVQEREQAYHDYAELAEEVARRG